MKTRGGNNYLSCPLPPFFSRGGAQRICPPRSLSGVVGSLGGALGTCTRATLGLTIPSAGSNNCASAGDAVLNFKTRGGRGSFVPWHETRAPVLRTPSSRVAAVRCAAPGQVETLEVSPPGATSAPAALRAFVGLASTLSCLSELRAFRMSRFGLNGGVVSIAWFSTACCTRYCVVSHCLWYSVLRGWPLPVVPRCCVASHCLRYAILRGWRLPVSPLVLRC